MTSRRFNVFFMYPRLSRGRPEFNFPPGRRCLFGISWKFYYIKRIITNIFFNCIKCYCIIVIVVYISFVLLAICYCSAVLTALFGFRSPPPPIPLPWHCGLVVPILTSVTQPLDLLCGLYTSTSKG